MLDHDRAVCARLLVVLRALRLYVVGKDLHYAYAIHLNTALAKPSRSDWYARQ